MNRFDFDDIVRARDGVPEARRGTKAWIVGIASGKERMGAYYARFPPGTVYTIEFEDGDSTDVHESELEAYEK
jgi:hypothetical protein